MSRSLRPPRSGRLAMHSDSSLQDTLGAVPPRSMWVILKRVLVATVIAVVALGGAYVLWQTAALESEPGRAGYVDMHVHAAGIGAGGSGAFIAKSIRDGYKFNFYLKAFDVTLEEIEREGDAVVLRKLSEKISRSDRVSKAVVLALDGVIGKDGELDRERTQTYVPNEYLARELAAFDNLLFGASINPYRKDAIERLEQAKRNGAVLVKWIPGIMDIDPSDQAIVPFYERMRDLGIPLLSHAGQERSFGESNDALGDPLLLELPLQVGVTVITAHLASTGIIEGQDNFDRLLPLFDKYDNLYADFSALTQINRRGYLLRALAREKLHGRLVYGSDWPLQFFPLVSPWYQFPRVALSQIKAIQGLDNQWDRDVTLKEAMGVPPSAFERSAQLLGVTP